MVVSLLIHISWGLPSLNMCESRFYSETPNYHKSLEEEVVMMAQFSARARWFFPSSHSGCQVWFWFIFFVTELRHPWCSKGSGWKRSSSPTLIIFVRLFEVHSGPADGLSSSQWVGGVAQWVAALGSCWLSYCWLHIFFSNLAEKEQSPPLENKVTVLPNFCVCHS